MFSVIETLATAILLIILMIFVIHLIRGDALTWVTAKFKIDDPALEKVVDSIPKPTGASG